MCFYGYLMTSEFLFFFNIMTKYGVFLSIEVAFCGLKLRIFNDLLYRNSNNFAQIDDV